MQVRLRRNTKDQLPLGRRERRFPLWAIGIITFALIIGVFYGGVKRHAIQTSLASGHMVKAEFARQYLLLPNQTKVKVAGVPVGVVTGIQHSGPGATVSMKVFGSNNQRLGTTPSAALRIGTLLGGISYVQLTPGGAPGRPQGTIPVSRTTSPIYIDSILTAFPPPAVEGGKRFIKQFQQTFAQGGEQSTQNVLADSPGALAPSAGVIDSLNGNQPGDLTGLVNNLEATDATVIRQQGQIESVVDGLGTFSATLGNNSSSLEQLAGTLGSDLANTRRGLTALSTILHEVDITANVARPSVQRLGDVINQSQPTLVLAKPVLAQLIPFLNNLSPVLGQLVPTSTQTTTFLGQIHGPVLNQVLNPILPDLNKVQSVKDELGPNGKPATLYQAIPRALSGLGGAASYYDGFAHFTPVIGALGPASIVPSTFPRSSGIQPTDSCAGERCPGDPTGDAVNGNAATPKSVTPPGYQP